MPSLLHYQIFSVSPTAPWIILIHGLFGSGDNLSSVRRNLAEDFNVLTVDLPDHGESPHLKDFSFSDWVERLINVMDNEHIESTYLLGHSLGGKIAMLTALHHPARVKGLMIADIAPVSYPPGHRQVFAGLKAVDLKRLHSRKDADKQLAAHIDEAGVRQFLLKSLYQDEQQRWKWRFNVKNLALNYNQLTSWPDTDEQYQGPTLFIIGGESDYVQPQHRGAIASYFPLAKAHIIHGAGHWLHAQKPEAFNKVVVQFLQQNS